MNDWRSDPEFQKVLAAHPVESLLPDEFYEVIYRFWKLGVETRTHERDDDTVSALEAALRLAKVGQIDGAVMFFHYHDNQQAFRTANMHHFSVPMLCTMMLGIANNLSIQFMKNEVTDKPELPSTMGSLGALPESSSESQPVETDADGTADADGIVDLPPPTRLLRTVEPLPEQPEDND